MNVLGSLAARWFASLLLNSRAASMVQPAANVLAVSVSCLQYNHCIHLRHWPPSKFMKVILSFVMKLFVYVPVCLRHGAFAFTSIVV